VLTMVVLLFKTWFFKYPPTWRLTGKMLLGIQVLHCSTR
jgi:hypothetical protein